jgi:hypothetical protein
MVESFENPHMVGLWLRHSDGADLCGTGLALDVGLFPRPQQIYLVLYLVLEAGYGALQLRVFHSYGEELHSLNKNMMPVYHTDFLQS